MTPIKIFWHVNELNGWNQVMDQQWDLIQKTGLLDSITELQICMNGQPWTFDAWLNQKLNGVKNDKIKLVAVNKDATYHEWPTLMWLWQQASESTEPFYICYLHLKGLLRYGDVNVGDWRDFMNWATIEKWKSNVAELDGGAEAVGTNYNTTPWPHFAGNFWWARSEYIKTLKPIAHPEDRMNHGFTQFTSHPTNPHWRFDHEAWLHSGNPKYVELAKSLQPGERHYRERYARSNYEKL